MRILLDANLSWRLVKRLTTQFEAVKHVRDVNLPDPAKDAEIWEFAKSNGYIIVTNDEDFLNLSLLRGFPPKVVLLRKGNLATKDIEHLLIACKSSIEQLDASAHYGLIEVF